MRQYLRLSGLRTGTARPPIDLSVIDRALGPIPGFAFLMDPGQIAADGAVLNRVDGTMKMPRNTTPAAAPAYPDAPFAGGGVFANGQPSIQLAEASRRSLMPDVDLTAEEWSVFAYIRLSAVSADTQELIAAAPDYTVSAGETGPRMGFTPTGTAAVIWSRGSAVDANRRLAYTPASGFMGREAALLFTFSVQNGLAIFVDGVREAYSAAAKEPLTRGMLRGQWRFFRGINADLGLTGILATDLGRDSMAGYRTRLFEGLAQHYG
ncbi:hypothetical protein [Neotabrizicola sp. VNH66]|uniref:hypothetical protein n=1 Tax=Neotabrizicola sp. VNH66 TaxID=3400918 RepID=UPI003BFAD84C